MVNVNVIFIGYSKCISTNSIKILTPFVVQILPVTVIILKLVFCEHSNDQDQYNTPYGFPYPNERQPPQLTTTGSLKKKIQPTQQTISPSKRHVSFTTPEACHPQIAQPVSRQYNKKSTYTTRSERIIRPPKRFSPYIND